MSKIFLFGVLLGGLWLNSIDCYDSQDDSSILKDLAFPCDISSETKVSVPGFVCRGQLLFEDTFKFDIEGGKIWTPEIRFPGEPDYPFNVYIADNVNVKDGILSIKPTTAASQYGDDLVHKFLNISDSCTGNLGTDECSRSALGYQILPPVITAKVTTKKSFNFKYGRIEVGARMPLGSWLIPEIQLEPLDNVYGSHNYGSGLLRIATVKGNPEYSKILYAGPIISDALPLRKAYLKEKFSSDHWGKSFHNYTMVWKPDGLFFYVDGNLYGEVSPSNGFSTEGKKNNVAVAPQWLSRGTLLAPFDQMFYISLGLSLGGIHEFDDEPSKPWDNNSTKAMLHFWEASNTWLPTWHNGNEELKVNYVRVYAL